MNSRVTTSSGSEGARAGAQRQAPFAARLLRYLIERFSLLTVVPASVLQYLFIADYSSGTLDPAAWATWLAGSVTYIGIFLCLRLSDDLKDKHHDDLYYADRPVQRGLISVNELRAGLVVTLALLVALNLFTAPLPALLLLLLILALFALMRVEFFMPAFLRPRLLLYLALHQMFVPVLAAYVIYQQGGQVKDIPGFLFLTLNLLMIMAVEIARKIRPTPLDQTGKDTYSAYLGHAGAAIFLMSVLGAAQALFCMLYYMLPGWLALLLAVPGLACLVYLRRDDRKSSAALLGSTVLMLSANMVAAILV